MMAMMSHYEIVIFIHMAYPAKDECCPTSKIDKPVKVDMILINDVMNTRYKVRTFGRN